jgi:hypothetical protein
VRTLPALLVVLLASCTFNRDVPAADGVSSVDCGDGGTCPPSADLCATIEPGLRRCVVRASWPSADITRLVVVASNDTPRTRFSRQPGFAKGAIVATVEGRPEQLVATIGTQVVPCGRTGDSYRCDFTVTADTPEGQTLARVEVTDAAGRVTADRVVLDFDFTAPRLIAGSVATRITPPASSPLATLGPQWAPSALATGSELSVSFGLDDFRVPSPALSLGPVQVAAVPSGAAFVATLGVDATLAEGRWPLVARLVDDVGNAREEMLGTFERDDTAPSARVDEVLVERRPFAPIDAGAGLFLSATGGLEPASAVLASTRTSPFPIARLRRWARSKARRRRRAVAAPAGRSSDTRARRRPAACRRSRCRPSLRRTRSTAPRGAAGAT